MAPRKQPLFVDLDETLIHAREMPPDGVAPLKGSRRVFDYEIILRPEAHEILGHCRAGGREVYLFTSAFFGFALDASQAFSLGFDETSIFSLAMILNCRRGLSPCSALIDNLGPSAKPTRQKMAALGIGAGQVWNISTFAPPDFPSARLFTLGLPLRLARLDRLKLAA